MSSPVSSQKIYLDVPYNEKDIAKKQGAKYDVTAKKWYYKDPEDSPKFSRWKPKQGMQYEDLSNEQKALINIAKEGKNVLVDACIGSGKTTSIQVLCDELPERKILYLTYNRLLKVDAKSKIHNQNTFVTNYHGFASIILRNNLIPCGGVSDLIQLIIQNRDIIKMQKYDLLLIDEYQDIDNEIAEMLQIIKKYNQQIQIIAVGDMMQKIYDKTTLDVSQFINDFLGIHENLTFTTCFRLNSEYSNRLGNIWQKQIIGVNEECQVRIMKYDEIVNVLIRQSPSDILCLGSRIGSMSALLNTLERKYPQKFNKNTVYASISDEDRTNRVFSNNSLAIFTTFDASKGLERKIVVIFDFTEAYWKSRSNQSDAKYEILRNIFCVAASRGKGLIIFVEDPVSPLLHDETLSTPFISTKIEYTYVISEMFDHKFQEDKNECFSLLKIERDLSAQKDVINLSSLDGTIDLSPCIGILQEAYFFQNYNIDSEIDFYLTNLYKYRKPKFKPGKYDGLEKKILYYVSLDTRQERYYKQVKIPFVRKDTLRIIEKRMSEIFTHDEQVQVPCNFSFINNGIQQEFVGFCDVLKDDTSELSHENYLQCAAYMIALKKPMGVIWNVKTNERAFITIPDRDRFIQAVIKTITKDKAKNVEFEFDF